MVIMTLRRQRTQLQAAMTVTDCGLLAGDQQGVGRWTP